ncbi:MAG: 2-oxo-4-hydroxy-4-carboxy-5-ureidoimidazoline decarboxylase [Thalassobaculales bacterium]
MIALAELNACGEAGFAEALAGVFEHSPWVAAALAARRPFASLAALLDAVRTVLRQAPEERRLALVRSHPDLAGRLALAGGLTADSAAEQAGAGLDRLSAGELAEFSRLNDAYRQRFGFPFIICVKRHGRESILASFRRRLDHAAAVELDMALGEVVRIAALRLADRVAGPDRLPVHGRLSTHVLDTHAGRPAAGVAVELWELQPGDQARRVAAAVTNADGRTDAPLIAGRPVPIARYELRFDIGAHFARAGAALADPPFLGLVPVRFAVAEPEGHYHVPLLATPWSYATYRGS